MAMEPTDAEFPEHADDNLRIWNANARWWDDRIGDGNNFQNHLIEPATERLLAVAPGERILDVACGAGRFTRRMAGLGARVVAFDACEAFIARARERTPSDAAIEYHVIDAARPGALASIGSIRVDKAVCTMAIMDMPEIGPLFSGLASLLPAGGSFVFSILHPCFCSITTQRFAETGDAETGRLVARSGVKVSAYLSPLAGKTEGIVGQPEPQWCFHRPLSLLCHFGFEAGFVVDGLEEPRLPVEGTGGGLGWSDMPDIPPILVVRMRRVGGS